MSVDVLTACLSWWQIYALARFFSLGAEPDSLLTGSLVNAETYLASGALTVGEAGRKDSVCTLPAAENVYICETT